jgi:hypothetical protein
MVLKHLVLILFAGRRTMGHEHQRKAQTQRNLWGGVVDVDVRALWEPWMVEADGLLEDAELIESVFQAQGQRHTYSATRGRAQTPAETALRLLLLKHVRNWSFDTLEREVALNLGYREFTRIGLDKVPDAKTLARIAQALGGEVIEKRSSEQDVTPVRPIGPIARTGINVLALSSRA